MRRALATLALLVCGCPAGGGGVRPTPEPSPPASQIHLSPLALAGRDVFVREGCHVCHGDPPHPPDAVDSSEVRPTTVRRGGPLLDHLGGVHPSAWLLTQLRDPRSHRPTSVMPSFRHLLDARSLPTRDRVAALRELGLPYSQGDVDRAAEVQEREARDLALDLARAGQTVAWDSEAVALVAYLQTLGRPLTRSR